MYFTVCLLFCFVEAFLTLSVLRPDRNKNEMMSSMDNIGETAATVLGREWRIYNDDGTLEQEIRKGTPVARAVVGLQPVIKPGASFIYYSRTAVSSTRGIMEGSFQVSPLLAVQG